MNRASYDGPDRPKLPRGLIPILMLWLAALIVVGLFCPAKAHAQTVPFTPPVTNLTFNTITFTADGRYAITAGGTGFQWLDTQALTTGYVQVASTSSCLGPHPISGKYWAGDCNGFSDGYGSNGVVVMLNLTGNCSKATIGCAGAPSTILTGLLTTAGTFAFAGETTSPPPRNSRTTDSQGRNWKVGYAPVPQLAWIASGGATPTPTPTVTATPAIGTPTPTPQYVCVTVTPHP